MIICRNCLLSYFPRDGSFDIRWCIKYNISHSIWRINQRESLPSSSKKKWLSYVQTLITTLELILCGLQRSNTIYCHRVIIPCLYTALYVPQLFSLYMLYFTIIGNRPVNSWTGRLNWTATYHHPGTHPHTDPVLSNDRRVWRNIYSYEKLEVLFKKAWLYRRTDGVAKALDPLL